MDISYKYYHRYMLIEIKEINLFLYGNFELKHVNMVTDL